MSEPATARRLPRWMVAMPFVAAALCLVALLPWLLYAPINPPPSYMAARTIGTVSLVAYPVLLAGLTLVSAWFQQRGVTAARKPTKRLFWLLFLGFVVGISVSLLLMLNA